MFVPVILICLLALAMSVLLLPLVAIAAIFRPGAVWAMLKTVWRMTGLFFKTRGLHVEISNTRGSVLIYHK